MILALHLFLIIISTTSEIINYSNHDFFLYNYSKDVLTYHSYAELFHVTNIIFYKENNDKLYWEISYNLKTIKLILSQLLPTRTRRRINELGTVLKWLAGTPDHDDVVTIENKINDLIENNNKQQIINSKLFEEIKTLSSNLKSVFTSQELPLRKHRLHLITYDLQNLIDTITLAKIDVFNTKILKNDDIEEIYKHELRPSSYYRLNGHFRI